MKDSVGDRRRLSLAVAVLATAVTIPGGAFAARSGDRTGGPASPPAYDIRDGSRSPAADRVAQQRLRRSLGRGGVVEADANTGTPKFVTDTDGALTSRQNTTASEIALDYVRRHDAAFGLDSGDIANLDLVSRATTPSGLTVLRWRQAYKGIPAFDNGLKATVRNDRLVSVAGPPAPDLSVTSTQPRLSAVSAMQRALHDVGSKRSVDQTSPGRGQKRQTLLSTGMAELTLFVERSRTRLAWKVYAFAGPQQVYLSVVDADTGTILKRVNVVKHAVGLAHANYPGAAAGGTQQSRTFSTSGEDAWLGGSFDRLAGDNALTYADKDDDLGWDCDFNCSDLPEPAAGDLIPPNANGGTTSATWNYTPTPFPGTSTGRSCPTAGCTWNGFAVQDSWLTNQNQAGTQLFWFINNFHDHLQVDPGIVFDDNWGNFEATNSVNAAAGSDPVIAQVNDGADTGTGQDSGFPDSDYVNNASMITLGEDVAPELRGPLMEMFLFTAFYGDVGVHDVNGSDDAAIVYHEYTHGLSQRLVDPLDTGGLFTWQGGAMGEAWSDWYALDYLVAQGLETDNAGDHGEVVLGRYENLFLREQGLDCPIGTTDPDCPNGGYTYGDFGNVIGVPEVHADGEIWAATLWDLRRAVGVSTARSIITDGMRISPAAPSFLDMRDAILAATASDFPADINPVREVFRARGMGKCASTTDPDDTSPTQDFTAFTAATCGGTTPPPTTTTPTTPPPTTTPTTPTTPAPTAPSKANFSDTRRSIRASRSGRFRLTFEAGAGLAGRIKLVTTKRVGLRGGSKKRRTLGRKSFTVPATGRVTVRFKLSRTNRRILKRYGRLRVKVTVVLEKANGLTSTATMRFRLRAPKPA